MSTESAKTHSARKRANCSKRLNKGFSISKERPRNDELVHTVFRALHTLKGSGAMFGFLDVAAFVHEFENGIRRVCARDGLRRRRSLSPSRLKAKDHVTLMIDGERRRGCNRRRADRSRRSASLTEDTFPEAPAMSTAEPASLPDRDDSHAGDASDDETVHLAHACFILAVRRHDQRHQSAACCSTKSVRSVRATVTVLTERVPPIGEIDPEQTLSRLAGRHRRPTDPRDGALDDVSSCFFPTTWSCLSSRFPARLLSPGSPPADAARGEPCRKRTRQTQPDPAEPSTAEKNRATAAKPSPAAPRPGRPRLLNAAIGWQLGRHLLARSGRTARRADGSGGRTGHSAVPAAADGRREQRCLASRRSPRSSSGLSAGLRDTTMGIRMVPNGSLFARFRAPCPRPLARPRQGDRVRHLWRRDRTRQDHDRAARRSSGAPHPQMPSTTASSPPKSAHHRRQEDQGHCSPRKPFMPAPRWRFPFQR